MHELLERLGRGDVRMVEMSARAHAAWKDFFEELATADVGTLSARLGIFQPTVQRIFEDSKLGQSLMAWTAFACLFDTKSGWGANEPRALELVSAFAASNCSPEVKAEAKNAAVSYELHKHPRYPKGL